MVVLRSILIIYFICSAFTNAAPLEEPYAPSPPTLDELLKFEQEPYEEATICTTNENPTQSLNGIIGEQFRWKNFNIKIDPAFNEQDNKRIQGGLYKLMKALPCVKMGVFRPDSEPSGDYVFVRKGEKDSGCFSKVGRLGDKQIINLESPGCMHIGTVMHEMIHSLGFYHEQSRPDRDDYVNIIWENISPGMESQFKEYSTSKVTTYGVPYNLQSIMHYGSTAFSKNGKPTIEAKNGGKVGSQGKLQQTDIRKLNLMYKCP
ncbi:Zinc metalloproteinase nas-13 [Pseudolycoriella hygida]|uniref:Metalloendopeptidase n=1 Tax=Pseudolycoriella hygida TaxID=35572 RepID=A0A9Q0SA42_9DIPT|nr:Zinc metalloproteinase nas-13 [Pseudolycoriella hygida]